MARQLHSSCQPRTVFFTGCVSSQLLHLVVRCSSLNFAAFDTNPPSLIMHARCSTKVVNHISAPLAPAVHYGFALLVSVTYASIISFPRASICKAARDLFLPARALAD
ncbi:hypothetical protein HPP92_015115 [Vanilla planifolia]|uniref:Uncharacterized protein n=1 Tax=Vanilla planifolia TaxID=51239 RepID=A0A835QMR4_VANPL|nr:hypothetical protein HPP92_015115 [Vanilla planifolia]